MHAQGTRQVRKALPRQINISVARHEFRFLRASRNNAERQWDARHNLI